MLADMPEMACEVNEDIRDKKSLLIGVRKWSMKKFRQHVIFYKKYGEGILIVRIIHGNRDIPNLLLDWIDE